jgi:hypothetical protein
MLPQPGLDAGTLYRLLAQYVRTFGDRYECHSPREHQLRPFFQQCCRRYDIPPRIPLYAPQTAQQISLS